MKQRVIAESLAERIRDLLFRPFQLKSLHLANRIVMAPMTRNFSPAGVPVENVAAYYERRAAGGTGLIITEGVAIDEIGAQTRTIPRFYGDDALEAWKAIVERVHAARAAIVPQLWHVGVQAPLPPQDSNTGAPLERVGPSGLSGAGEKLGRAMNDSEIADTIAAYAAAAAAAKRIGCDGIELHGAHGYLIDQFLWSRTNRRADAYGGDSVARTRFAAEVVAACRRAAGPDFAIILRFSQWKSLEYGARLFETPGDLEKALAPLATAGVDALHCSQRRFWEAEFADSELNLAGWTRKLTGKPTISVGSVLLDADFKNAIEPSKGGAAAGNVTSERLSQLLGMMERDEFDLIAIGRALIANPQLPRKLREGTLDGLTAFSKETLETLY
jgi:2,4-dienoyl-CoA reductase-like NADH-dependent reductase (Old Yellow Enzyme family)